jgi:hypothetical protein
MLACIVDGRTDFRVSDYFIHCPAGNFILVPPGVQHPTGALPHIEARDGEINRCTILWVQPWGRALRCWLCTSTIDRHERSKRGDGCFVFAPLANEYFRNLVTEAVNRAVNYERICGALI